MNRFKSAMKELWDVLQGTSDKRTIQYHEDRLDHIRRLPIQQAEELAMQSLRDWDSCDYMENEIHYSTPTLQNLSTGLQKLFEVYSYISIREVEADSSIAHISMAHISIDDAKIMDEAPGFLSIGMIGEAYLGVRPHEEGIYEIRSNCQPGNFPNYPSIYHWILMLKEMISAKENLV